MQQLIKKTELKFKNLDGNFSIVNIKIRQNTLPTDFKRRLAVIADNILEDYMNLREKEFDTRGF